MSSSFVAKKTRSQVENYILEAIGEEAMRNAVIEELFERDYSIFNA